MLNGSENVGIDTKFRQQYLGEFFFIAKLKTAISVHICNDVAATKKKHQKSRRQCEAWM